ncbi:shikimate kinase [Patescibacteria group bacterium]
MNITFIGMPGVGKSVVGKALAKKLNYKLLDIDDVVEDKTGLKLQKIIDDFGDEEFIKIEGKAILELGELNNHIISPGGSVIYSVKAMDFLKEHSTVIFLNSPFEDMRKRIKNQDTRGIVGLKKSSLEALFNERVPLYKKYADITVEVLDNFNTNSVVQKIIEELND